MSAAVRPIRIKMRLNKLPPIIAAVAVFALIPLSCHSAFSAESATAHMARFDAPDTQITATNSSHRGAIFKELGHDFKYLSGDPTFYLLMAGLSVTPSVVRHEAPEINEAWANDLKVDHVFEFGNMMGNGVLPVTTSVLALSYGKFAHRPGASDFGSDLLRAQAVNGMLTLSLKGIFNRTRPDGRPYSFPSGHTSTSFTTAAVIYRHFGWKLGVPAAAAATYVGLSRLQENRHYLSDVIAGAVLGSYVGYKVAGRHSGGRSLSIAPMAGDTYGLRATVTF